MRVESYPLGWLQANCYLIWNKNHVLIVDPGGSSKKVVAHIREQNGIVDAILLTHGHHDHIGGVDFFSQAFACPVYISEEDEKIIARPEMNCSDSFTGFTKEISVKNYNRMMHIGAFNFTVIDAPGHTNGSVLLIFDDFMCSGDVLFKQSIGRSDLPTGSNAKMIQTLRFIKTMDPDLVVYPGHGEKTTLHAELMHNMFLKDV